MSSLSGDVEQLFEVCGGLTNFQITLITLRVMIMAGRKSKLVIALLAASLAAVVAYAWGLNWLAAVLGFMAGAIFAMLVIWR